MGSLNLLNFVLICNVLYFGLIILLLIAWHWAENKNATIEKEKLEGKLGVDAKDNTKDSLDKVLKVKTEDEIRRNLIDIRNMPVSSGKQRNSKYKMLSIIFVLVIQIIILIITATQDTSLEIEIKNAEYDRKIDALSNLIAEHDDKNISNKKEKLEKEKESVIEKLNNNKVLIIAAHVTLLFLLVFFNVSIYFSDNTNTVIDNYIKELTAKLEYRLLELSEDTQSNIIIKLPNDENYLEVEKILSADQKLQINSYVWHRTMKAPK